MTDIPSLMAYHHLHDWLRGNIVHVDMDFNLDDVPQNDFAYHFSNMLDRLETGDLKRYINICLIILMLIYLFRWSQFMVFITSHSDPETGYLHLGPNNIGSVPVKEV